MGCACCKAIQNPASQPPTDVGTPVLAPMLVMPFEAFKRQGRICKCMKKWRKKAFSDGTLIEFDKNKGMIAIFVSHTWWDRNYIDETNNPNDPFDKGAPDWQTGPKKDLKHRVICAAIEQLIASNGWDASKAVVWVDWQSIYQDDKEMKLRGIKSLIHYTTCCEAMLIPSEDEEVDAPFPEYIFGYGKRGWCRAEYFFFSLSAAMKGCEGDVHLYAAATDGTLKRYKDVSFDGWAESQHVTGGVIGSDLPEGGDFSNEADRELIRTLQDQMIENFGHVIIRQKCEGKPTEVLLNSKMLGQQHMLTLCEHIANGDLHQVEKLEISRNAIGDAGAVMLADALAKSMLPQLKMLTFSRNEVGDVGHAALADTINRGALPQLKKIDMRLRVDHGLSKSTSDALKADKTREVLL